MILDFNSFDFSVFTFSLKREFNFKLYFLPGIHFRKLCLNLKQSTLLAFYYWRVFMRLEYLNVVI